MKDTLVKLVNSFQHFALATNKSIEKKSDEELKTIIDWLSNFKDTHYKSFTNIHDDLPPESRHLKPSEYWNRLRTMGEFQFPEQLKLKAARDRLKQEWNNRPEFMKGIRRGSAKNKASTEVGKDSSATSSSSEQPS
jgi:hypothetical protein